MIALQEDKLVANTNPFPGLRPFQTEETHLFFGREGQIDEVLEKLEENRFVAVLGTSGSGKSSLMYCGLIPSLYGGFMTTAGSNWRMVVARPGISPIMNLAKAFVQADQTNANLDEEEKLIREEFKQAELRGSSLGLVELVKQIQQDEDENFLIMVDQFEELFRFNRLEDDNFSINESFAFVKLLMEAVRQKDVPIYVVMTMRSDYIGDCASFPQLTSLINDSHYLIPQMTRDQKREAILGPVAVGGAEMTPRLVQQLLNDLGDNPDQLPILQHALMRTWNYWQELETPDEPVDIYHYEAIGMMSEALSQHANEAYEELDKRQKEICAVLFKSLTEKGSDGRGVRRPTRLSEIAAIAKAEVEELIPIVDRFRIKGRTFLMPPAGVPLYPDSIVDISHESLMRVWVRCRDWVEEESEAVKTYLRLCEAAALYQIGKTSLWRPPDLQLALNWQAKHNPNLLWAQRYDPTYERAMVFLETSKNAYEEEQRSKDRIQRRQVRFYKIGALIFASLFIIGIMLVIYANLKADAAAKAELEAKASLEEANRQTALAEENARKASDAEADAKLQQERAEIEAQNATEQARLARLAQADALAQRNRAQAALAEAEKARQEAQENAAEAEKQRVEAERQAAIAQQNLDRATEARTAADRLRFLSIAQAMAVKSIQIKNPEQKALIAKQAYNFHKQYEGYPYHSDIYEGLYNAEKKIEGDTFNLLKGHTDAIRAIVYHPKLDKAFSAGSDGTVFQWVNNGTQFSGAQLPITGAKAIYRSLSVSNDGKWMVAGTNSNGIRLIDLTSDQQKSLNKHKGAVWSTIFTPDSRGFFSTGADQAVYYWDLTSMEAHQVINLKARAKALSINSLGTQLAAALEDGSISVWSVTDGYQAQVFHKETGDIGSAVAFSPNGNLVAHGYESGKVFIYDLSANKPITDLEGHDARISQIQFSRDGKFMATASLDHTVRIWNLEKLNEQPIVLRDHDTWVQALSFSPDGKTLMTGTVNGTLKYFLLDVDQMAERVCEKISRPLSDSEWNRYVGEDIYGTQDERKKRNITCKTE